MASATRCAWSARQTCRASSRSSSPSRAPAFLEVMIDPDAGVYPMVGPGQSYDEMITGDFIPSRRKVDIKTPGPSEMF